MMNTYCRSRRSLLCGLSTFLLIITGIPYCLSAGVDLDIQSYETDKKFSSDVKIKSANNKHYITGQGDAGFDFNAPIKGWYELWVEAANWDTRIELDNKLLTHANFLPIGNNVKTDLKKIANLYLDAGKHRIRFERIQFPGLPYLANIKIIPSKHLQGKLTLTPQVDYLVFRKNEDLPLKLTIAKEINTSRLQLDMIDDQGTIVKSSVINIPQGTGNFQTTVNAPTINEGAYRLLAKVDGTETPAIIIDYVVVDTKASLDNCNKNNAHFNKELVLEIDPAKTSPDYFSDLPIVTRNKHLAYVESGNSGVYQNRDNPAYFGYKLKIPAVDDSYLIEADYPEDKSRTFTISLIENDSTSRQIDSGVTTGYFYPLSGETKTHQIYFFPRIKEPRLLFINWDSQSHIALQKIRLYKIILPRCKNNPIKDQRKIAYFYEENLRYPAYFGGKNNSWVDLLKTTERWANWSSNLGVNRWVQAIASYQSKMWPSEKLPGYAMSHNDGFSFNSDFLQHDPLPKDLFRLLLLVAEKYGIEVNGELQLPVDKSITKIFPSFNSDTDASYLIHDKNKRPPNDAGSPYEPYLNPIHPDVVNWISSIFSELENRYSQYSAFDGLTVRFMPWDFHSWQAFPSINWGYDPYSLKKFMAESGLSGALNNETDLINLLTTRYHDQWISWRQNQVMNNLIKYKKILTRNNQKLSLDLIFYGPNFSLYDLQQMGGNLDQKQNEFLQQNDWKSLLQETGINLDIITSEKQINAGLSFWVPSGLRDRLTGRPIDSAGQFQRQNRADLLTMFCRSSDSKKSCHQNFYNEYLEIDFPLTAIGLTSAKEGDNKKIRLAAAVEPSGEHTLEKYTTALYNGNVTALSYGGLGYILGQPEFVKDFIHEYSSLPSIPMQRSNIMPEPVALWHGTYGSQPIFYLVNSAYYPVALNLSADQKFRLQRLTNDKIFEGKDISLTLAPYQLMAFESNLSPAEFKHANLSIPSGIEKLLNQQVSFVKNLMDNNRDLTANSPSLKYHYEKLVNYQDKKQYRSVRLTLLSPEFIELYMTTNQFPPWLLFDAPPEEFSINTPFTIH